MKFDPIVADIRFGTGLSPTLKPPQDVETMLQRLASKDSAATTFPIRSWLSQQPDYIALQKKNRELRQMKSPDKDLRAVANALRKTISTSAVLDLRSHMARSTTSVDGFRERLVQFWADHFTAIDKAGVLAASGLGYVEDAIRPHIAGNFSDMLRATTTHPLMLHYLNQNQSFGPNSELGQKRKKGLNENFAREVLELHTLGVDGPYSQNDVRELAELLTGLRMNRKRGFVFYDKIVEPGPEIVLGTLYGESGHPINAVYNVLNQLAVHPSTARHIARKLAVHFVSDEPDQGLVDAIASAFSRSGGALLPVYEAMLTHPSSWNKTAQKVRQPFDFIIAAVRALGVPTERLSTLQPKEIRRVFLNPMVAMGQQFGRPLGPDGWPENASYWISPQGLAARVEWSMRMPQFLMQSLPDPRIFVEQALGGRASADLKFAANAAETRAAGIGIILVSPDFQRR